MLILSKVQNVTLIFKQLYSPSVVFVTDQIAGVGCFCWSLEFHLRNRQTDIIMSASLQARL